MSRHIVARAPLALAVTVVTLLAMAFPASAQETTRLSGETPVQQAIAWSQVSFADGSAPDVIIARDDDFADALGSGAVQGLLEAPLLLTNTATLSPETAAEIQRLGSDSAIILGGVEAVSAAVETELGALGVETERIAGATRLETAVAIVARFFPFTTDVALARAFGTDADPTQAFADSLTLAPFSAATNIPSLLTSTDSLDQPTMAALAALPVQRVLVVGGTDAISESVASAAAAAIDDGEPGTDESVTRVAGANRFQTAVLLDGLMGFDSAADAPRIIINQGQNTLSWASGFPAGAQTGNGAAVVLANGDNLPQESLDFITGSNRPIICGPGVSQSACDQAEDAVNS